MKRLKRWLFNRNKTPINWLNKNKNTYLGI